MSNLQKYHISKNLCDNIAYKTNYSINAQGVETPFAGFNIFSAECAENSTYTISLNQPLSGTTVRIHTYNNGVWIEQTANASIQNLPITFTTPANADEIRISITNAATGKIMLNAGGSDLPYEPYSTDVWHDLAPQQYINGEFVDTTNNPEKYSGGSWP